MILELFKIIMCILISFVVKICVLPFRAIMLCGVALIGWLNGDSKKKIKYKVNDLDEFFNEEFLPFRNRISCLKFQQLKLYSKLKHGLKHNELVCISKDDCRAIGKTTMLVKLAREFDASIIVPTLYQKKIFSEKYPDIKFIVANESARGKRLGYILFEEGIDDEVIHQVFIPMSKNFTGYKYA